MEKILPQLLVLFLISSVFGYGQISGSWRQVFPEENGEIPGPRHGHYMAPIGDQQVLMIGGSGGGNPHYYANETWLYDYPTNKWTKLNVDFTPNTYSLINNPGGNIMHNISKNRVLCTGTFDTIVNGLTMIARRLFLFDLDSMKWFRLNDSVNTMGRNTVYLEEGLLFGYITNPVLNFGRGKSFFIRVHTDEPFDSPNFITRELVNDENITGQGPGANYRFIVNNARFTHNNNSQEITYIPFGSTLGNYNDSTGKYDLILPDFMNIERDIWKWFFLNEESDAFPFGIGTEFSNLINNVTLIYNMAHKIDTTGLYPDFEVDLDAPCTYLLEYIPSTKTMKVHPLDITPNPGYLAENHRLAKIKDGVVMLFGGINYYGWLSNETWIFELDTVGIVNNYNETVKIYTLGHNLYLLGDEIKDAVLYNVLGQKITEFETSTIDLNHLSLGIYFLHYTEKASNLPRVVKLLRK